MTGAELRAIRLQLGLTQGQMGQELDLSLKTIWRHEQAKRVPRWLSFAAERLQVRLQKQHRQRSARR